MLPFSSPMQGSDRRRLLRLFARLAAPDQATLLKFAEFLAARQPEALTETVPAEPKFLPRPARESVVAAIRRLSASYGMLERQDLLNETAALMTAHVLHGRPAKDVIDNLEAVFAAHYARYEEAARARASPPADGVVISGTDCSATS